MSGTRLIHLIGQAWVKLGAGDQAGADEDLAAAAKLVPADTIEAITHMTGVGDLPSLALAPLAPVRLPRSRSARRCWSLSRRCPSP